MTVEQLTMKQVKLWNAIRREVSGSIMDLIVELVQVELELEERSNQ